jgi:hypothetical protein
LAKTATFSGEPALSRQMTQQPGGTIPSVAISDASAVAISAVSSVVATSEGPETDDASTEMAERRSKSTTNGIIKNLLVMLT